MIAPLIQPSAALESTLSLNFTTLRQEIAYFLNYGRTSSNWGGKETSDITLCLNSGLRQFLGAHDWSFLQPWLGLPIIANQYTYDLPPWFASVMGDMYFDTSIYTYEIELVSEHVILSRRQAFPDSATRPRMAAVRYKMPLGSSPQRQELLMWPTPDTNYTLRMQARVNVGALAAGYDWPPGGLEHAETIFASCLAFAEAHFRSGINDQSRRYFDILLPQSIERDRSARSGRSVGVLRRFSPSRSFADELDNVGVNENMVITYQGM